MDILSFARGPALMVATTIFIFGVVWRLVGLLLLRARRDLSQPRRRDAWKGLALMGTRSWPRREFVAATGFIEVIGYTFHLGLFAALFLYAPHVVLFKDVLRAFLPLAITDSVLFYWPTVSGGAIYFLTSVSVACLIAVLLHRLINPVKRLISNFDDYMSWFLTITPLATGMAAYTHFGGPYQLVLAIHILSVEALMIWFPFGKLMHMFTMFAVRGVTGVLFARKGAAL